MSVEKNTHTIPARKDVPVSDTWDLAAMYASESEWESDFNLLKASVEEAATYRGTLGSSSQALLSALKWLAKTSLVAERVLHYAFLCHAADGGDPQNQRRRGMASQVQTTFAAAISFVDPEIQSIDESLLRRWIAQPEFADFQVMIEKLIRFKPHVLLENEERILALQSEVGANSHGTFGALTNVDFDFGTIETPEGTLPLTQSTYSSFMQNRDRKLREKAYRQFYAVYDNHKNTLASLYDGSVKQDIFRSKVRSYADSRSMFLFPDRVDGSVYDNLIAAVHEALPLLHRYYDIRRRMLKLDKLAHYDAYVPLVEGVDVHHPYEEAVRLCCEALAPLGADYVHTIRDGLTTERWVDRYENKGKRSGAFSAGSYSTKPYILLNYKEDVLRDVFTMIHEGGHSMHSYYSVRNNPYPSYDYTIFEAEVASTFNEQLLADYLFKKAESKAMAAYVVGKQIDDIVATLFRQTMFAEYEMLIHRQVEQGEPITVESLRSTYRSLLETYFGPEVELLAESDLEGMRIPHFYTAFYVYKYATGLSASIALADKVMHGTSVDRDRYLDFLKSGGSTYPIDSLKTAGVDMSTPEPVRNATRKFGELLDQFENLMA
ncbi:MAG: oligoendopeptidase F [Spirochaetae bacterium HGW-Spirochaetae-8]|nr:MAG: oligoendopeptidase F [Spirochaetae bacterium HGW-Spirochaetae-8]